MVRRAVFHFFFILTAICCFLVMTARAAGTMRSVTLSAIVSDSTGLTEIFEMGVPSPICNTSQPTYSVFCGVNLDIYIADPLNGSRINVGQRSASHPVWAENGLLAWQSIQGGNWEIFLWDSTIGNLTNISQHPAHDMMPALSEDGQLAWSSERDGDGGEIYLWDGKHSVNVTQHPAEDRSPVWTRDEHLGWLSNRNGRLELYVFAQDQTMRVCDSRVYLESLPDFRLSEITLCEPEV